MSTDKSKPGNGKGAEKNRPPAPSPAPKTKAAPVAPYTPPPPMFRRADWLSFVITTLLVFIGYYLTIAPDLTLQDSGELAVASMYAGVPHPPGYPVWTIYSWLFTVLLPVSNIAWRVSVSSAVAGALSCGLIALMVSRGSSMILESIAAFKELDRKLENASCVVAGFVAGMLMGFNGYFWSQANIVEVYTFGVLSLVAVMCLLMRWLYAPEQRKFLYWCLFIFGICFTNHQTLIVAAMGIEFTIMLRDRKLGRDLFFFNSVIFIIVLLMKSNGSFAALNGVMYGMFVAVGLLSMALAVWMTIDTGKLLTEWKSSLILGFTYVVGAAFYLYMPIASMSNPPLNWGYPRTVEGFYHALTRGQYEGAHPTSDIGTFIKQLFLLAGGAIEEFNVVYLLIGLIPFFFIHRMQKRERAWMLGLTSIYLCLAILLLILLNPQADRQSLQLNKVFFTASHVMLAMFIGYGLTLMGALVSLYYERARYWLLGAAAASTGIALYVVMRVHETGVEAAQVTSGGGVFSGLYDALFSLEPSYDALERFTTWFSLVMAGAAVLIFAVARQRAPMIPMLALFCVMPFKSVLSHWDGNEQKDHLFGYWFGHDMFTPPFPGKDGKLTYDKKQREELLKDPVKGKLIYPEMTRDTVLYGGTDPGRFCPTYTIFCESFTPPSQKPRDPDYDRRDVYIITQNALADATYLMYIRAHFNRSTQTDPPFFQEFVRSSKEKSRGTSTNLLARIAYQVLDRPFTALGAYIETQRRSGASYFEPEHFTNVTSLAALLRAGPQQTPLGKFLFENISAKTQALLSGTDEKALRKALAKDLNTLLEKPPIFDEKVFAGIKLTDRTMRFVKQNPTKYSHIRLNRILLEEAFPKEITKSEGGVYPDLEIRTPGPNDSQKAFEEYVNDAQKRMQHDISFPNEPKQIKPGEDVKVVDNRIQVSGQVAVMAINGLLTKDIFDKNPNHDFYVEESFPLDWMFPHLTPFGIILKIERQPVAEITEEMVKRDHEFWSRYSERMIGNWITYDTSVSNICDFVERVYIKRDFTNFKGDRKFIRDEDAQKAFSKLRSAIAGVYTWRINPSAGQPHVQQRMVKEADFAFRQSFAFCPYSPEAVFRYTNLLISLRRYQDALSIALTFLKLDPHNGNAISLVNQLKAMMEQDKSGGGAQMQNFANQLNQMRMEFNTSPTNAPLAFNLFGAYMQVRMTNEARAVMDILLLNSVDANALMMAANCYNQLNDMGKVEQAISRLVNLAPNNPEAWYDLGWIQAMTGRIPQGVASFKRAIQYSDARLKTQTNGNNLRAMLNNDPRLKDAASPIAALLRGNPDFQTLTKTNQ
ncbi:MAG: DUF2723 domain-containing protein [Verrucomicrobia bacterium]|nr:DUF2723 domain-containing protein [Verrucomicrobiota bacterium]